MTKEDVIKALQEKLEVSSAEATKIVDKAVIGGEISRSTEPEEWLKERFLPNLVLVDRDGYAKMCVDALKILGKTAPTDFGGSRQRDLAQLWADMTRGYIGELAFTLLLKCRWNIDSELGHDVGELAKYLPLDIHRVRYGSEDWRKPKLKMGVKTGKWNGIWFDIPGDQFGKSDIHCFVKTGAGREHLFAFFKSISVFKDKILKMGLELGSINSDEHEELLSALPSFRPVPAYVCGFVKTRQEFSALSYSGKKGRKHYTIRAWNGPIEPGDLEKIKEKEGVEGHVKFEGIGKFNHDRGYLFNIGNLRWKESEWRDVLDAL